MKRKYRIEQHKVGYIPQVKYGWLPWWDIGTEVFWGLDNAKKACDLHNTRRLAKFIDYNPEAIESDNE